MRPHISYSEAIEFSTVCQYRWKLNYLDELREKTFSIHFDFGTSVHEAIESYFTRKEPVSVETAILRFKEKLCGLVRDNGEHYPEPLAEADQKLLDAGERILISLKDTPELKDVEVIHNEYPLFTPIERTDGIDIKFKGFIDIVVRGKDGRGKPVLWVCDFKTCSWGWDGDTRQDRLKHYQLFLYKYFLCKKFDLDLKQVRTAFVLLKKRPPKGTHPVEFFPVSAGPVSVQRALDFLNGTITEMSLREKDMSFRKDRNSCIDSYGHRCPFYQTPMCP